MDTTQIVNKIDELVKEKQKLEKEIYGIRVEQNALNRDITEKRIKIKDLDMVIEKSRIMIQERKDEITRLKNLYWEVKA